MKGVLAYIKNVSKGVIFDTLSLIVPSKDDIYRRTLKKQSAFLREKHIESRMDIDVDI